MSRPRQQQTFQSASFLGRALAFLVIILAAVAANGQSTPEPLTFRRGQSMYIVAYRSYTPYYVDETPSDRVRERIDYDLDAERKVRKRIEEWPHFKVAEKLSDADFVFLVHLDESSMEGLAIPIEAYRQHFKENYDLDTLRDAAFGRYLIGPLKLPTVTRLSDRLVKQFREKVTEKPSP